MIELANKIIVNLIGNIEKYRVNMYSHKNAFCGDKGYTIHYCPIDEKECCLQISIKEEVIVSYRTGCGAALYSNVTEDEKYELLGNTQKLLRACENYTSTQMRMFADSFDLECDDL